MLILGILPDWKDVFYVPLVKSHPKSWRVASQSASVDGKTIHRKANNTAVLDTGTALCLVDKDLCAEIYTKINGMYVSY